VSVGIERALKKNNSKKLKAIIVTHMPGGKVVGFRCTSYRFKVRKLLG